MLGAKERAGTHVMLEFFSSCIPVFEQFLLRFQKSSPVVHILYDCIMDLMKQLMRRFMKSEALEGKYGPDLADLNCKDAEFQLADQNVIICSSIRKVLKEFSTEQQRHMLLGICSFFHTTTSYLQQKLPLPNSVLRQLTCLNPDKRKSQL